MAEKEQLGPIVLTGSGGQAADLIEGDCACADTVSALPHLRPLESDRRYRKSPSAVLDPLSDGWHLAFLPSAQGNPAVLNPPAVHLLSFFERPRRPFEATAHFREWPELTPSLQHLLAADLLTLADTPNLQAPAADPKTLVAWVHVTNRCNLRCDYCYVSKSDKAMPLETGRATVDAVFRSALAHQFQRVKLKYAGGEATLNLKLVADLHEYARSLARRHELELDGVVLSNGVAIGDRMIETLRALGLRLAISLDGLMTQHDELRVFANGQGSFWHVERTLDRLQRRQFTPSITITLSGRNASGLPAVVEYLLERRLPFTVNFYRENDCSASYHDLVLQDDQIIEAMLAAFKVIEANLPPYSLLNVMVDRAQLAGAHQRPCGVGDSYMVIDHHGGVAKCHMEIEQTITNVMEEDPLQLIREDQRYLQNPSVDEKEGCRACEWRYWCAGGCPALTFRVTGRYDVKSPNCRIYKALFPELLRLEGLRILRTHGVSA